MFCPKCGLQNADDIKFCRGCGGDITSVLAMVEGKPSREWALREKYIELYSRGIRGLLLGFGFLIIAAIAFAISTGRLTFFIFSLAFSFMCLATGISRLVEARGLKALDRAEEPGLALPVGQTEYIKPVGSIYSTDDLQRQPFSVTERTTTHLVMDPDERS